MRGTSDEPRRRTANFPPCWLFTDSRLGGANADDALWRAIARLPRGSGIIFRHHDWPAPARRALLAKVQAAARRRGLLVLGSRIGGTRDGHHLPRGARRRAGRGLVTAPAHDRRELLAAFRAGADLVFLSPAFPTATHPGAPALGALCWGLLARGAPGPVLALGGMTPARLRRLQALGARGFGAVDWWAGLSPGSRAPAAGR
jgi:thiamine-phosphate pyrophosphorylase